MIVMTSIVISRSVGRNAIGKEGILGYRGHAHCLTAIMGLIRHITISKKIVNAIE